MEKNLSLELKNISKTFPGVKALSDVSFSAYPGKVCGLVGVNGAGKSTLMNILGGIHQPDKGGEIIINGESVVIENPRAATKNGIAFIQQEVQAFEAMSVYENILASQIDEYHKRNNKSIIIDRKAMKEEAQAQLDSGKEQLVRGV